MRSLKFLRKHLTATALVTALPLLLLFQNCSQTRFLAGDFGITKSENNGAGYGGKPSGDFYHFVPDFTCEKRSTFASHLLLTDSSANIIENKKLQCGAVKRTLALSQVDTSIYQRDIVGFEDAIFEARALEPASIPANLVEVWCRDAGDETGIESITHFDRATNLAVNRLYYTTTNANGASVSQQTPDFSVARAVAQKTVTVRDGKDFEVIVHRDRPALRPGLFEAELSARVNGQLIKRPTACRLGGTLDARLWPVKQIVDVNVFNLKTSSDAGFIAFGTDSLSSAAAPAALILSKTDGTKERIMTAKTSAGTETFAFSPDAKRLVYQDELGAAPTLWSDLLESAAPTALDSVTFASGLKISADGQTVVYHKYNQPTPPNYVLLKSVPITGGAAVELSPVGAPSTMGAGSFDIVGNRVVFSFGVYTIKIYASDITGANLQTLSPGLPADWGFVANDVAAPNHQGIVSSSAWNYKTGASANYLLSLNGAPALKMPEDAFWISSSPSNAYGLLQSRQAPRTSSLINFKTGERWPLPSFVPDVSSANPTRDGAQTFATQLFSADSTAYVGLQAEPQGAQKALAISLADLSQTELCPGLNVVAIAELASGEYLLTSFDPAAGILALSVRSASGACRQVNALPLKSKSLKSVALTVAKNQQNVLLTVIGAGDPGTSPQLLFYVPLSGQAALQVNTPVSAAAALGSAFFLGDSKTVLYLGDQIRPGETNVFLWSPP